MSDLRQILQWIQQKQWTKAERALRPFLSAHSSMDSERERLHRIVRTELQRLCDQPVEGFEYLGTYSYRAGAFEYRVSEYEHLLTGIDFVLLPPQNCTLPFSFLMGSPEDESYRNTDETLHWVTFTFGFLVSKVPITQKIWCHHRIENPSHFQQGEHYPVEQVSWDDCQIFCKKLGLSLPTEAQWEYAARGGSSQAYAFGETLEKHQALFLPKSTYLENPSTTSVATYPPNAYGLYDMHGNVSEWCQDWYGSYPSWEVLDPIGPPYGLHRIYRGGSFMDSVEFLRSACRFSFDPGYHRRSLGFRVSYPLKKA